MTAEAYRSPSVETSGPLGRSTGRIGVDFVDWVSPEQRAELLARPARKYKTGAEIRSSLDAIVRLTQCDDRRVEALGKGGYFAAAWAAGRTPFGPATGIERPDFNHVEVSAEVDAAGRAAAGMQAFPHSTWCDEGRIAARGVEEWLAWAYIDGYPTPPWLMPDWSIEDVAAVTLGDVGAVAPGLVGPGISRARFPYDVVDEVERLP